MRGAGALLAALLAAGAPAQTGRPAGAPAGAALPRGGPPAGWEFGLETSHAFMLPAAFERAAGSAGLLEGDARLGATRFLGQGSLLSLGLRQGWREFDWRSSADFVAPHREPFGRIDATGLDLFHRRPLSDSWSGQLVASLSSAREERADWGHSWTGLAALSFRHQWTDAFALSLGAVGLTRLGEGPLAFPILLFEWKPTERLRLELFRTVRVSYLLDRDWGLEAALSGGFDYQRFRLDDRGAAPGGIGEYRRIPLRLELEAAPFGRTLELCLFGGALLGQELRLEDRRGHTLAQDELAVAPFFGFEGALRF